MPKTKIKRTQRPSPKLQDPVELETRKTPLARSPFITKNSYAGCHSPFPSQRSSRLCGLLSFPLPALFQCDLSKLFHFQFRPSSHLASLCDLCVKTLFLSEAP